MPATPSAYINTSQANMPYQSQPQPYNPPPMSNVYQSQNQGNPYSKTYTQPSPQHVYMQPRQ